MARLGLVSCVTMPEPDPDQDLMIGALRAAGHEPSLPAWDDDAVDWSAFDLCVLRSTWNYHEDAARFDAWLDRAAHATMLANPIGVVRWNLHKRYLAELEAAGLPIVPTAFASAGEPFDLVEVLSERGWSDVVIKPCVSAGSARTRRFRDGPSDEAAQFLAAITARDDAMIQPFVPSVEDGGERSAVWIGGEATHAIVKQPRFDTDNESVSEALPVTDEERNMLDACMEIAGDGLLYARLDTMRDAQGGLMISELELIEPSLFLLQSEVATARFVDAVSELAGG